MTQSTNDQHDTIKPLTQSSEHTHRVALYQLLNSQAHSKASLNEGLEAFGAKKVADCLKKSDPLAYALGLNQSIFLGVLRINPQDVEEAIEKALLIKLNRPTIGCVVLFWEYGKICHGGKIVSTNPLICESIFESVHPKNSGVFHHPLKAVPFAFLSNIQFFSIPDLDALEKLILERREEPIKYYKRAL